MKIFKDILIGFLLIEVLTRQVSAENLISFKFISLPLPRYILGGYGIWIEVERREFSLIGYEYLIEGKLSVGVDIGYTLVSEDMFYYGFTQSAFLILGSLKTFVNEGFFIGAKFGQLNCIKKSRFEKFQGTFRIIGFGGGYREKINKFNLIVEAGYAICDCDKLKFTSKQPPVTQEYKTNNRGKGIFINLGFGYSF